MIEIGQILRTNYGTGPYRVERITRGCTCKAPLDFNDEGPDMPAHVHLVVRGTEDEQPHNRGEIFHLGWYDEETLKSVVSPKRDRLILCENPEPIQRSLLFV